MSVFCFVGVCFFAFLFLLWFLLLFCVVVGVFLLCTLLSLPTIAVGEIRGCPLMTADKQTGLSNPVGFYGCVSLVCSQTIPVYIYIYI